MKTNLNLTSVAGSLFLLALCCAPTRAQARGGSLVGIHLPNNPGMNQTLGSGEQKTVQPRTITGRIERLLADENAVVIRDEKTNRLFSFSLGEKMKFKADKGTDLAGRKNLSLADFRAGQTVRLKYRPTDGKPLELRLRADKG